MFIGTKSSPRRTYRVKETPRGVDTLAAIGATGMSGAAVIDDLVALRLEGVDPLVDRRESCRRFVRRSEPQRDARGFEQIVKLRVGQLHQQTGEKRAAF